MSETNEQKSCGGGEDKLEQDSCQGEIKRERRSGQDRRRSVVDRRSGLDRRRMGGRRASDLPNLEVRRGAGIRRSDERRAAEEGEMTDEQFEFVMAIEEYKRVNNKTFPTWTEVLDVIKKLGYRKVEQA